jgi:hypothetical protein
VSARNDDEFQSTWHPANVEHPWAVHAVTATCGVTGPHADRANAIASATVRNRWIGSPAEIATEHDVTGVPSR